MLVFYKRVIAKIGGNALVKWELKNLHLQDFIEYPDSLERVFFQVALEFEFVGEACSIIGQNVVMVATPEALRNNFRQYNHYMLKRILVIDEFDFKKIKDTIKEILQICSKSSKEESYSYLRRYVRWEYEGYDIVEGEKVVELELRDLSSSNVASIEKWRPNSLEQVFISLDLEIGLKGETASNMFHVKVATPEALRSRQHEYVIARNRTLVIDEFDFKKLREAIQEIMQSCSKQTWEESCICLQRFFQWEYEDYR